MGHEQSVKEWRDKWQETHDKLASALAQMQAYERQIRVMAHMLEQRDAAIRQYEFNGLVEQAAAQDRELDDATDRVGGLFPVPEESGSRDPDDAGGQGGDYESTPDLEDEVV